MSSHGYIKLYRSLFEHEFFRPGRFSEREAFTWMIKEAAWKPRSRRVGQFFVELERGELAASLRHLADVWMWEVGAVRGYLARCEKAEMLSTRSDKGITVVSVCNYDYYQGDDGSDSTVDDNVPAQSQHSPSTAPARSQHKTEEGKKVRKEEGEEQTSAPGLAAERQPTFPALIPDASVAPKKPRRQRQPAPPATLLDPNFELTEADRQYARDRHWDDRVIDQQFEKFKNHHIGKANRWADWHRAWMTWVGNGYDFKNGRPGGAPARSRADSTADGILAGMESHERFDR